MPKVVTATEAKNRLGALMGEVTSTNQPVMIELRGHPNAALISASEFERYQDLDRQARLAEAQRLWDMIRADSADLNMDLTPAQADALAIQAVREVRAERSSGSHRKVAEDEPIWSEDDQAQ